MWKPSPLLEGSGREPDDPVPPERACPTLWLCWRREDMYSSTVACA